METALEFLEPLILTYKKHVCADFIIVHDDEKVTKCLLTVREDIRILTSFFFGFQRCFYLKHLPGGDSCIFCRFRHHSWVTGAPAFGKGLWSQKPGRLWTLCPSAGGKRESNWRHLCHESHEEEGLVGPGAGRRVLASHSFPFLYQNVHCGDSHLLNWHLGSSTFSWDSS